jgi:hypothetical protein
MALFLEVPFNPPLSLHCNRSRRSERAEIAEIAVYFLSTETSSLTSEKEALLDRLEKAIIDLQETREVIPPPTAPSATDVIERLEKAIGDLDIGGVKESESATVQGKFSHSVCVKLCG